MSTVYDEMATAEPKRDGYGRYMIVPAKGGKAVAHTRATTVAETLDDRYNLELWKMRQVALGLSVRPDLLAQVAAHTADDKKVINGVCKDAMDAAASQSGANMGTALHRIIERHNRGELDDCPDMFRERLDAYIEATEPLTIRRDLVERVAVLGTQKIAGMFDLGAEVDGTLYVADLKTGSGIDFGARGFAVQLAIYAMAETLYDYATDTHVPAPGFDRDRAVIIHLPAAGGPCELHWLDIHAGSEALEHAMWTRKWRSRKNLLSEFTSLVPALERSVNHDFTKRTPPPWTPPDEGDVLDRDAVIAKLAEASKQRGLDKIQITALNGWVTEGDENDRPWRISKLASVRRFTIYRGAVRLLEAAWHNDEIDSDYARAVLTVVLGDEVQPAVAVGTALGSLSTTDANHLILVCDALATGDELTSRRVTAALAA